MPWKQDGDDSGFTLIEMMVVVVILAVLVSIVLPSMLNYRERAMDAVAMSRVDIARKAELAVFVEDGGYTDVAGILNFFTPGVDYSGVAPESVHVVLDPGDSTRVLLYSRSESGAWFGLRLTASDEATCEGNVEADMTLAGCSGDAW